MNVAKTVRLPRHYCTICHRVVAPEFRPGPGGRPDAGCPRCGSLERHRFFAILLSVLAPQLDDLDVLLEVAPSRETSRLLADLSPRRHVRLDLGADPRTVDVYASLTEIPFADDSVDLLVCYHVLEHVPDDRAAMREIARVLSPSGVALVQVPFRPGRATDEDPSASVEERLRRFGQADHVRWYGDDLEDRLVESGLSIHRITPRSMLGEVMSQWLHLNPDEMVWLVRARSGASVPPPLELAPTGLTRTLDTALTLWADADEKARRQRRRARRLRQELDQRPQPEPSPVVGAFDVWASRAGRAVRDPRRAARVAAARLRPGRR